MAVDFYIVDNLTKSFIELDSGSWSWLVDFIPDFINENTSKEYLKNLLKTSINLSWKSEDEEVISYWTNKIRNFLINKNPDNVYLVMDDGWQKYDFTYGLIDDITPPFYFKNYLEIKD